MCCVVAGQCIIQGEYAQQRWWVLFMPNMKPGSAEEQPVLVFRWLSHLSLLLYLLVPTMCVGELSGNSPRKSLPHCTSGPRSPCMIQLACSAPLNSQAVPTEVHTCHVSVSNCLHTSSPWRPPETLTVQTATGTKRVTRGPTYACSVAGGLTVM